MSVIPTKISKNKDKQILRVGIIAELDAVNLYEQMANASKNPDTRKVLLDIAKEEKTHTGEFLEMLIRQDKEQKTELGNGKAEVMKTLRKVV
jgi:rubrerythrin